MKWPLLSSGPTIRASLSGGIEWTRAVAEKTMNKYSSLVYPSSSFFFLRKREKGSGVDPRTRHELPFLFFPRLTNLPLSLSLISLAYTGTFASLFVIFDSRNKIAKRYHVLKKKGGWIIVIMLFSLRKDGYKYTIAFHISIYRTGRSSFSCLSFYRSTLFKELNQRTN